MNIESYRQSLREQLLSVENESLLLKIGELLEKEAIVGYTTDGKPLTSKELGKKLEESRRQAESGEVVTTDELRSKLSGWKEKYRP